MKQFAVTMLYVYGFLALWIAGWFGIVTLIAGTAHTVYVNG